MNNHFIPVVSSNIAGYLHLAQQSLLLVTFKSGKVYAYQGVPESVVADFVGASSKGSFFSGNIRNNFPASEIDDDELTVLLGNPAPQPAPRQSRNTGLSWQHLVAANPWLLNATL